jgi:broad specificity phosphatase PhoE
MIVHLVRHPPVAKAWQKRCYGQSDPGLSRGGRKMIGPLVDRLVALGPDIVIHSDMKRTRAIAEPLAKHLGLHHIADRQWRERNFGDWEGQTWSAIYRATGNAMDGMIDDPEHFRPGGGETTSELIARIQQAVRQIPDAKRAVILSHGGPIACCRLILGSLPASRLAANIPALGEIVTIGL